MRYVYRVLIGAVPPPFNVWIRAHEAELAFIDDRMSRILWAFGLVPLSIVTFTRLLAHKPSSLIGGTLMRSAVASLSFVNITAGFGLAVLYFADSNPPLVGALSFALVTQGMFTLALLGGLLKKRYDFARHIQIAGSTLAVAVGSTGVLVGLVANLSPSAPDPEFGPMTVAMLFALHGVFSLIAFSSGRPDISEPTTGT